MPRNRTVRLAVLGSSVQRSTAPGYASRQSSALKRRIVVGVLCLLSLVLITVYFRESSGGKLHDAQGVAAGVLRPFEIAAERVARPFRDASGYVNGLFSAKSENEKLHHEVDTLRQQVIQNESALQENVQLRRDLAYRDSKVFPRDFRPIAARVISNPPSPYEQRVVIAAGHADGIRDTNAVVTADGLVGQVTKVFSHVSQVTLLTDDTSAVSAVDLPTAAAGILRHGQGSLGALILDQVAKEKTAARGDVVITAGSPGHGKLPSIYPRGIQIGIITSVGTNDTENYKQVQVQPFVDFSSLSSVLVLVPR